MGFNWNERYVKGIPRMDATHREFVEMVDQLLSAADEHLPDGLQRLLQHTQAHFDQEQLWMEACSFPPIAIHQGEHQRVLGVLEQTLKFASGGDLNAARAVIDSLPQWFEQHAASMDNALAMHMRHAGLED
jgi:hemerythrin